MSNTKLDIETDRAFSLLHGAILELVMVLVDLDPPLNSPESNMLIGLSDAIHAYESVKWPIE